MQPTLCPHITTMTPQQFYDYVLSLRKAPETAPESKAAVGIKLHVNAAETPASVKIRCKRDPKAVTEAEVAALAIEYSLDALELTALFNKRKFQITNANGEVTNDKPKSRKRSAPKRNAQHNEDSAQAPCPDQLFVAGADSNLSTEGAVQSAPGITQGC